MFAKSWLAGVASFLSAEPEHAGIMKPSSANKNCNFHAVSVASQLHTIADLSVYAKTSAQAYGQDFDLKAAAAWFMLSVPCGSSKTIWTKLLLCRSLTPCMDGHSCMVCGGPDTGPDFKDQVKVWLHKNYDQSLLPYYVASADEAAQTVSRRGAQLDARAGFKQKTCCACPDTAYECIVTLKPCGIIDMLLPVHSTEEHHSSRTESRPHHQCTVRQLLHDQSLRQDFIMPLAA